MVLIEKEKNSDIVTFKVDTINAFVTDDIRPVIIKLFETPGANVILDLDGVEYIDSTGFGLFLIIMKAARNNYGALRFTNINPTLMALFENLQLHTVFTILPTREECLASF